MLNFESLEGEKKGYITRPDDPNKLEKSMWNTFKSKSSSKGA